MYHIPCILAVVLAVLHQGNAYSIGAPITTCWTMYPKHQTNAKSAECPFNVVLNPGVYTLGENITITVSHPNFQTFTGVQIGAFLESGNDEMIVGQFVDLDMNHFHLFNCFGGSMNMATHSSGAPKTETTFVWQAPNVNMGNITFRSSIVQNYETFWVNVETPLESSPSNGPVVSPSYPAIPLGPMVEGIDFDPCGDTKGCFMYPRHCDGHECLAVATYQYRNDTDDILMELFSSTGYDYVSLAFSQDDHMGDLDETFSCFAQAGIMSVQHGVNPLLFNERFLTSQISNLEIRKVDGDLSCRFVFPRRTTLPSAVLGGGSIPVDHLVEMHLQMAWGDAMPGTTVMTYHKEMPVTSDDKVDMRSTRKITGSAFWELVRVHGAVMIIAWCLFAGIVTVVSRHYKDCQPDTTLCGTKVWFQVHRGMAILVAALSITGIATIFAKYGTGIREHAKPHAYWGLVCFGVLGLQIVGGFFRPGPDSSIRVLFNWGHWFMGHAGHILAAVTMFLAFDIEYINDDMRDFGFITLGIWLGVQLLWHFIFELVKWCSGRRSGSNDFELDDVNASTALKKKDGEKGGCKKDALLLMMIYVVTLMGCTVAVLCAFLFY